MDGEGKLHDAVRRGIDAKHELSITADAFATLKAEYMRAWEATTARDTDARERLWQAVQIVGKVEGHLHTVLDTGKLAERQLGEIERLGERKKFMGVI